MAERRLLPARKLFPPFYADCGKNITIGNHVFFNSGCNIQDQGGITIDDGALIGHNVVLATLNRCMIPEQRANLKPAPIRIGKNVWIGANTIFGGVPAKKIRDIPQKVKQ